jgi:hypothetical protein
MNKKIVVVLILFAAVTFAQTFHETMRFGGLGSAPGQFSKPTAISAGADAIIYIVDSDNNRIQLFDFNGKFIRSIGGFGFGNDQFNLPKDIWTRTIINIYISDSNNQRLVRYDRYLNYINALVSANSWDNEYQFQEILSCAINSQRDFFLLDRGENKIVKINRLNEPERSFGYYDADDMLQNPVQIDIIQGNKLAVSDASRKSIMIYDFFGTFIKEIAIDGFKVPSGLSPFKETSLLVTDPVAKKIFLISPDLIKYSNIKMELSSPLVYPRDITVYAETKNNIKQYFAFIIDNNEVIVGRITDK